MPVDERGAEGRQSPRGSGLARDSDGSVDINAALAGLIASKLAPTGIAFSG
jgi:hypothetical protein